MVYWKGILQIVIGVINSIYILSLLITWMYYPAGPIYDIESDKIIG